MRGGKGTHGLGGAGERHEQARHGAGGDNRGFAVRPPPSAGARIAGGSRELNAELERAFVSKARNELGHADGALVGREEIIVFVGELFDRFVEGSLERSDVVRESEAGAGDRIPELDRDAGVAVRAAGVRVRRFADEQVRADRGNQLDALLNIGGTFGCRFGLDHHLLGAAGTCERAWRGCLAGIRGLARK